MIKLINRESFRFLLVGISTVSIDLLAYLLLYKVGLSYNPAKTASFFIGTIYAYFLNKSWTFSSSGSKSKFVKFILLYTFSMILNVGVNHTIIITYGDTTEIFMLAFFMATLISAMLNFLGMKYFIFNDKLLKAEINV